VAWCEKEGLAPLPARPQTVAFYLTERAEAHTVATIEQELTAISAAHQRVGLETPRATAVVRDVALHEMSLWSPSPRSAPNADGVQMIPMRFCGRQEIILST
jgi:hypothetical protein